MFIKIGHQILNIRHIARITHDKGHYVAIKMDDGECLKFENNPDALYQRIINKMDDYAELMTILY